MTVLDAPERRPPTNPRLGPWHSYIATDSWPTSLPRGRVNQAPRPEGFQRAITGLADYITGNKWDFDQRGRGGSNRWEEQIGRGTGGGNSREAWYDGTGPGRGDPSIMMETIPRRPITPLRQWNAPNDLTVSQGAEQGVRRGGGILNRIGDFLGRLGGGVVPGSPEAPADMQGTQMVRDPQTGEWVHPNVLKHWSRQ